MNTRGTGAIVLLPASYALKGAVLNRGTPKRRKKKGAARAETHKNLATKKERDCSCPIHMREREREREVLGLL